jgi:cytochrome bd-type quinol oxidase subunit 2
MFGMTAGYTFLAIVAIAFMLAHIGEMWAKAYQSRGAEREKTRQLEAKASIKRAEADAKMVAGWQPPKIDP